METTPDLSAIAVQSIVEFRHSSERVRFCITDRHDHIPEYHASGRFYEEEQLQALGKLLDREKVVLDIGANIGNHSIYMAKILRAKRIVPFEVNPDAIALLNINLALNDCHNVDVSYLGVGMSSHDHRISKSKTVPYNLGGTRFAADEHGAFISLAADPLVAHLPVGAVKIDVEGMEMDVMEGLRTTFGRWRPVLFVELEDRFLPMLEDWMRRFQYLIVRTFSAYDGKTEYLLVPA